MEKESTCQKMVFKSVAFSTTTNSKSKKQLPKMWNCLRDYERWLNKNHWQPIHIIIKNYDRDQILTSERPILGFSFAFMHEMSRLSSFAFNLSAWSVASSTLCLDLLVLLQLWLFSPSRIDIFYSDLSFITSSSRIYFCYISCKVASSYTSSVYF